MLLHSTEAPEFHHKIAPEYMVSMQPPSLSPIIIIILWDRHNVTVGVVVHIVVNMMFLGTEWIISSIMRKRDFVAKTPFF